LNKIHGLVSAAFTPVNPQGDLDFTNLPKMAARMQEWGIHNVMVGGTTGESLSFTYEERVQVVKEWLKIANHYDLDIYVHTGMDSV
jgi:N-acetylneuraminate lyase